MKEYRSRLKKQNVLLSIAALALIAAQILSFKGVIKPVLPNQNWAEYWNGFIAGAAMGVTALFIFGIITNIRAMRNEKALKKLFAKENDERTLQICAKGKSAGASFAVILLLLAGIISGYFNITVFVTCIVCVFIVSVSMALGKLYYNRKM